MLLGVLLTGCPGYPPTFSGSPVWEMFPFDGEREWKYKSTDDSVPYYLVGNCDGVAEKIQGTNVYTVDYTKDCVSNGAECVPGDRVFQLRWSSTSSDGVFVWAYDAGDGFVDLDPPVRIAEDMAARDDVFTTTTGGATWTSTMVGIQECPIRMSADWPECGTFDVRVDVGDGAPLVGTWWAVAGNGIAAFTPGEGPEQWQLSSFDCAGECSGHW